MASGAAYFTNEELRLNMAGHMSPEQSARIRRLIWRQQRTNIIGIILAWAFMVGLIVFYFFFTETGREFWQNMPPEIRDLQVTVFGIVQVVIALGLLFQWVIRPRIAGWGKVRSVNGTVRLEEMPGDTGVPFYYILKFPKRNLFVPQNLYNQFINRAEYTVYYCDMPQLVEVLSWREGK